MSHFYFNQAHQPSVVAHPSYSSTATSTTHHGTRSRRTPRYTPSQAKPIKAMRSVKESSSLAQASAFLKDFEAARSFELEDDELFCPWHLLTEDDLQSIHSSSSDRSSSSSGSPETSPLQHQLQPTSSFTLSPMAHTQMPSTSFQQGNSSHLKLHQPLAQRTRNAIPIVDPNSRATSPPTSVSPTRQAQKAYIGRRW